MNNPFFEYEVYSMLRRGIFKKYLSEVDSVVEFGAGTGTTVWMLLRLFPELRSVTGCDWSNNSCEILKIIAEKTQRDVRAVCFNMKTLEGQENLRWGKNSGVVTMHSMEQLGKNYAPFLNHLLEKKPKIVVHLEPIFEFYREGCLLDHLAKCYHEKRDYLRGYLQTLEHLEKRKVLKIIEKKRFYFGSLFHEGYSLVVWRPGA